MKKTEAILVTAGKDKQGDIITPESLESMVKNFENKFIPIGIEHDPRVPPFGRFYSVELVKLDDGTPAVKGIGEVFEEGDLIEIKDESKEISIYIYKEANLDIIYDYNFRNSEDQKIINEIAKSLNGNAREEFKKSLDPISLITIGGAFTLGAIATGFFTKMGADAWDKLKTLMSKKRKGEKLLRFELSTKQYDEIINVSIILSNPSMEDMDNFLNSGLHQLDKILPDFFKPEIGIKKIVCEFSKQEIKILFGVRKDAVPIYPKKHKF